MPHTAVQVEGIGKQYQLGLRETQNQTFREALIDLATAPVRRLRHLSGHSHEDDSFWALKDVAFDVPEGEVLGIIGHNGAGKSTLLKILSRITEPTEGRATIHGRVASLLEVGTGFHNELTGRENIYLNGAILGMSKAEIDRKFDEIVDFSGVEKFLDTPIKRYSSGMKVRLAFSVAAHLEPEILIIDEVLAVGDAEFQSKCLGKMNDVAQSGRTVLFVSHNMAAVETLCTRCILLSRGSVAATGTSSDIISNHLHQEVDSAGAVDLRSHSGRDGAGHAWMTMFRILDQEGRTTPHVGLGENVRFEVDIDPATPMRSARMAIRFFSSAGHRITTCHTEYQHPGILEIGRPMTLVCEMSDCRLAPGRYHIDLQLDESRHRVDHVKTAAAFDVVPRDVYGTTKMFPRQAALFYPHARWDLVDSAADRQTTEAGALNA